MVQIGFDENKRVELEVLCAVADYCDKNNLQYFLAYGTLIGAVRHKGFIPWDDDIDIWMPRADYNKFIKEFRHDIYEVIDPKSAVARHPFVKVVDTRTVKIESAVDYKNGTLGVDIDIFPLDGMPDNDGEYLEWYNKIQKYYKAFPAFILKWPKRLKSKVKRAFIKLCFGSKDKILSKAEELHSLYNYDKCSMVGSVESCYNSVRDRYKKEWFEETASVDFEGLKFKAPIGYHEVLTAYYGDYMKLPPEEERVTHHSNTTYWKDTVSDK